MNWIKKIIRPLLLFGLPLVVIACTVSYKFNGSSINYDKVKTISIADFPIKSEYVYAPLATKFNEDLKDIFIRQTRLQLLKPNQNADLQIDGEITGYNQYNQAVSADGYSSETKLTITVNVRFVNNTNDETKQIILENINRSPLYAGKIEGVGPRYCPSFEDKIMRLKADQVF